MSGNRVLRYAALALCLAILPLTVFAAVSMGARISQHGLSPERLWGLVAIVVACAFGLAYLVAVVRGHKPEWKARVRDANLHLAAATCVVALILALPIVDFGSISAKNQLARLESGEVSAKDFDYAALRWDFGDAGRKALGTLAKSGNGTVSELAQTSLAEKERSYRYDKVSNRTRTDFALRVQPEDPALRQLVLDYLVTNPYNCEESCVAIELGRDPDGKRDVAIVNGAGYDRVFLPIEMPRVASERYSVPAKFGPASKVEIRIVDQRYIFVDGKPVGPPLDELEATPPPR